jgi:hypothetical protein
MAQKEAQLAEAQVRKTDAPKVGIIFLVDEKLFIDSTSLSSAGGLD